MAKKSSKSKDKNKKKKGSLPRGKKARAKAKLDRQWGERVDGDDNRTKAKWRVGPSRVLQQQQQQKKKSSSSAAARKDVVGDIMQEDEKADDALLEEEAENSDQQQQEDDRSILSSSDDSSDNDDDVATNNHHNNATESYSTLLHSILVASEKKKKKEKSNDFDHVNDDDSSSSEESAAEQQSPEKLTNYHHSADDEKNTMDTDDDDDDVHSCDIFVPSRDPFTSRFVGTQQHLEENDGDDPKQLLLLGGNSNTTTAAAAAAAAATTRIQQQAAARHRETVKLLLTEENDDDNDDEGIITANVDVQVSKHLAESLKLPTKQEDSEAEVDTTTKSLKRQHQRRARRYLKSFYRTFLHQHQTKLSKCNNSSVLLHNALLPVLSSYADVLWTVNDDNQLHSNCNVQELALRHALNHVATSRARIYQHDKRLNKKDVQDNDDNNDNSSDDDDDDDDDDETWKRDQGFTRPTVLILLPTRHCCYTVVQQMQSLLGCCGSSNDNPNNNGNNKKKEDTALERFVAEYGPPPPLPNDDDNVDPQERHRQKVLRQKGPAWNDLFGDDRNADDDFKLGVALHLGKKQTKKTGSENSDSSVSLKLFTDFYRSDIILASPLGLKMTWEADDNNDADFLSSIEICLIDQAEVLLEQNWDHVNDVLARLNRQPQSTHESMDFSRVRPYFLQPNQAQHWRQLIVTSSILDPTLVSAFKRHAQSGAGVARVKRRTSVERASIAAVLRPDVRQVFQRVACRNLATQSEDRLQYFMDRVLPHLERTQQKHTLIFIPSYFDFCSLRNALLQRQQDSPAASLDFCSVTEYARATEVSRGRARFLQGRRRVLLYTGRAHFFLRHAIKGARHVIFFGVPAHPEFYSEHVNRLNEGLDDSNGAEEEECTCLSLYTKYDAHALERIVGASNCSRMVKGDKTTYFFSSS